MKPWLHHGRGLLGTLIWRWPGEATGTIDAFTSPLADGDHFLPPRAQHLVARADVVGHVLARRPLGWVELLEDGAPQPSVGGVLHPYGTQLDAEPAHFPLEGKAKLALQVARHTVFVNPIGNLVKHSHSFSRCFSLLLHRC